MPYSINTPKTWDQAMGELKREFQRWSVMRGGRIEFQVTNVRGRHEVTLAYQLPNSTPTHLVMDKQATAEDNLRVLYLAIEAIRKNEMRGIGDIVREAYLSLPAPMPAGSAWEVLGIRPGATLAEATAAYRAAARGRHSDAGGDDAAMRELNLAFEEVKKSIGTSA